MASTTIYAKKANRQYTIAEAEIAGFIARGFDIYRGDVLVKHGAGKVIAYADYQKLLDEFAVYKDTADKTEDALKKAKAEINTLKKQLPEQGKGGTAPAAGGKSTDPPAGGTGG